MRIFFWPSSSRQMNPSPRICKRRSNFYKGIWKDAGGEVRLTLARDFLVAGGAIPQDDKQAALRMQYAVKRGSLLACGLLADLYEQGRGIPKDRVAACVWLKLSLLQNPQSRRKVTQMRLVLTPTEIQKAGRIENDWLVEHPE